MIRTLIILLFFLCASPVFACPSFFYETKKVDNAQPQPQTTDPKIDNFSTLDTLLVIATFGLFSVGLWQGFISRNTATRQLRAYVSVDSAAIVLDSPTPGFVTAWIRIKNFGVTPAYKVRIWHKFSRKPTDNVPFDQSGEYENNAIVGSGGTVNSSSTLPITPEQLQAIKDKQISFFLWGRIEYIDAFKKPHYFNFKSIMNGKIDTVVIGDTKARGWGFRPTIDGDDAD